MVLVALVLVDNIDQLQAHCLCHLYVLVALPSVAVTNLESR